MATLGRPLAKGGRGLTPEAVAQHQKQANDLLAAANLTPEQMARVRVLDVQQGLHVGPLEPLQALYLYNKASVGIRT